MLKSALARDEMQNVHPPPHPPSRLPPCSSQICSLLSYFLPSLCRTPVSRTVSLSLLSRKSAVDACLKVRRYSRKSVEVTPHLSTLKWYISGTQKPQRGFKTTTNGASADFLVSDVHKLGNENRNFIATFINAKGSSFSIVICFYQLLLY